MMMILLFTVLFGPDKTDAYPLYVSGNPSSIQTFIRIMNSELPADASVTARLTDPLLKKYGISFLSGNRGLQLTDREDRFLCAMQHLLGDSTKTFRLTLVESNQQVLIGDGFNGILDMADIEKFNTGLSCEFTAGNVLLHELYEQYYLQVVKKIRPGRISAVQLRRAHQGALQKESILFNLLALKTKTDIMDNDRIYIEFTNRADSSRVSYNAYYDRGNVESVEMNVAY